MDNNRSPQNPPKYIRIYNAILKHIKNGLYNQTGKLPAENHLALELQVSRMTLRRALLLLQEDGVIEMRKGVGNFLKENITHNSEGLEYLGDVLHKCGVKNIDTIQCEYRIDEPELYSDNIFERSVSNILSISLYYYYKEVCYAESFSIIPNDIDIIKEEEEFESDFLKNLVMSAIYDEAKKAEYVMKIVSISESLDINKFTDSINNTSSLVTEKLFDKENRIISFTKYRIPSNITEIIINSSKKVLT